MKKKSENANQAILCAFPSVASFEDFVKDNNNDVVQSIVKFAYDFGIIKKNEKKLLFSVINDHSIDKEKIDFPEEITLNALKETANIQSIRWLTQEINKMIDIYKLKINKVSNTMFTRLSNELADTVVKRNTLRLLAIWIGFERPHLILPWNYESLLKICPSQKNYSSDRGVRLLFRFHSRGDVINEKTIRWLKNELKECLNDLNIQYARINGSQNLQLTEFSVDLPQEYTDNVDFIYPITYNSCIRDSINIAHQIHVRWSLSQYNSERKYLSIGIAAGFFNNLDMYLQAITNIDLNKTSAICVTDYIHHCVLLNDIRVIFSEFSDNINMANGEKLKIWWIDSLWSHIYLDYIPSLLTEEYLPLTKEKFFEFTKLLYFSKKRTDYSICKLSSLLTIHQNTTLMIEFAKVCLYRRMFHEANTILSAVLTSNSYHIVARTMRMQIFLNLGLQQSQCDNAQPFFKRAITEGKYITKKSKIIDEEPLCEFGLVYFSIAIKILRNLRSQNNFDSFSDEQKKEKIFIYLKKAEDCFEEGSIIAPFALGIRSNYWLLQLRSLRRLLELDNELMTKKKPFKDLFNIYENEGEKMFNLLGWKNEIHKNDFFYNRIFSILNIYINSVGLRSYLPNVKFAFASLIFDFTSDLTTGLVKYALNYLYEALDSAKKLQKHSVGIYSITHCLAHIQSTESFITYVEKVKIHIERVLKDDLIRKDTYRIDRKKLDGFKIILFNIDEMIEKEVILNDQN